MEIRRVQITGGSSYVITLPKEWIRTMNIKKNDQLGINIQSDGALIINPKITQEQLQKIKEFNVSKISKPNYLLQLLIGAYISGYTSLKITSPTRMSTAVQNVIRSFTQLAIGPEVVEETDKSVTLKDLLNPMEMPLDRAIKRMYIIVKGMYEDTIRALQTNNKNLVGDVFSRDDDVDRLHWLVARQYNIILQNVSLAGKMDITIEMASTCFLISRIIERIGDHTVRIAQNISKLVYSDLNKQKIDRIIMASSLSLDIFNKSMGAFFKKDIKASNKTIESVAKLELLCEEINAIALKQKGIVAIYIGYVVESIKRIGEYAEDISENVINYLVMEEQKIPN